MIALIFGFILAIIALPFVVMFFFYGLVMIYTLLIAVGIAENPMTQEERLCNDRLKK